MHFMQTNTIQNIHACYENRCISCKTNTIQNIHACYENRCISCKTNTIQNIHSCYENRCIHAKQTQFKTYMHAMRTDAFMQNKHNSKHTCMSYLSSTAHGGVTVVSRFISLFIISGRLSLDTTLAWIAT